MPLRRYAIHHEADDGQTFLADRLHGEEGSVEGTQLCIGDDEDRESQRGSHVGDHEIMVVERDEPTAGTFDEEDVAIFLPPVEGGGDSFPIGGALLDLGGDVGGERGAESNGGDVSEYGVVERFESGGAADDGGIGRGEIIVGEWEARIVAAVGMFGATGRDGLAGTDTDVEAMQGAGERGGDGGFSDVGTSAGDKQAGSWNGRSEVRGWAGWDSG